MKKNFATATATPAPATMATARMTLTLKFIDSFVKRLTEIKDENGNVVGTKAVSVKEIVDEINRTEMAEYAKFKIITARMKDGIDHIFVTYTYEDGSGDNNLHELNDANDVEGLLTYLGSLGYYTARLIVMEEVVELV